MIQHIDNTLSFCSTTNSFTKMEAFGHPNIHLISLNYNTTPTDSSFQTINLPLKPNNPAAPLILSYFHPKPKPKPRNKNRINESREEYKWLHAVTVVVGVAISARRWGFCAAGFENSAIWCEIETSERVKASDSNSNIHATIFCDFSRIFFLFWLPNFWQLLERVTEDVAFAKHDVSSLLLFQNLNWNNNTVNFHYYLSVEFYLFKLKE